MSTCPFCGTEFTPEAYARLSPYRKAVLTYGEDYMADTQAAKARRLNASMTAEQRRERARQAGLSTAASRRRRA